MTYWHGSTECTLSTKAYYTSRNRAADAEMVPATGMEKAIGVAEGKVRVRTATLPSILRTPAGRVENGIEKSKS
jgi:hypothetical protein